MEHWGIGPSIVGALSGGAAGVCIRGLPMNQQLTALTRLCTAMAVIDVGAAIRSRRTREIAIESTFAFGFVLAAAVAARRGSRTSLTAVVLGHSLWDAGQRVRHGAAPPASWYPELCAAFDVTAAAVLVLDQAVRSSTRTPLLPC